MRRGPEEAGFQLKNYEYKKGGKVHSNMRRGPEESGSRQDKTPSPQPARSLDIYVFVCY